jgi:hypothetical protein
VAHNARSNSPNADSPTSRNLFPNLVCAEHVECNSASEYPLNTLPFIAPLTANLASRAPSKSVAVKSHRSAAVVRAMSALASSIVDASGADTIAARPLLVKVNARA